MRIKILLLYAVVAISGMQFSCRSASEEADRPNIVWITSEDNSKHYLKLFDDNGVATPNIEALAKDGLAYTHAFSNAPVCSAARSTLISGCYGPRLASQYHRKIEQVSMPASLEMFPAYLRKAGYYTTNNNKEDYNIVKTEGVWDESSKKATWRNRSEGQPFFHVQNIGVTHESSLHFSREQMNAKKPETDPAAFTVQSNHPETELFNYTNAMYRDKIVQMDKIVGEIVSQLKEDGLLESTIIFYFADNGGVLPGSKGYLYETGVHVPLVVHVPAKYRHLVDAKPGSRINGFVSFVDFGATVLNLAGVDVPEEMDGKAFLGEGVDAGEVEKRNEAFSYADRFDEKYDMVRALRKGRYKYIRSYQPYNYDALWNNYRYKQLAYQEWLSLYKEGALDKEDTWFFESRPAELLFDVEADPYETKNLAGDPVHTIALLEMREKLNERVRQMPDLSFYPEHYLVKNAFDNPVKFGQDRRKAIGEYIAIADLVLLGFDEAKPGIEAALKSDDPWKRYWGLIVCSGFGKKAIDFAPAISAIAKNDEELINRVKAAEYLGIAGVSDPAAPMVKALYATQDRAEGLLILNSMELMSDLHYRYKFDIQPERISENIREFGDAALRINRLTEK